jgi:glycosyltransferase involved in cell wall biosynthesis
MPALNEEKDIAHVIATLPKAIAGIDCIECLVIDDGSTDKTAELALGAGAKVVLHRRNRGVGAAFQSAVQFALENEADILVGIDADRQFDPTEIPAILGPILTQRADMVIGNRFTSGMPAHMPPVKYWGNKKLAQLVSFVSGQSFQDVSCGFRAYSREALLHLNVFGEFTYTHETILSLAYQGLPILEYSITVTYDPERKSRVAASIFNYAVQTSKIVLRVMLDYRPIRVFGGLGAIFILVGMGFELFLLTHYIMTHSFSPYKATGFIGLGFIVFGMLVLVIALIADMLNRLRMSQDKALYELRKIHYDR